MVVYRKGTDLTIGNLAQLAQTKGLQLQAGNNSKILYAIYTHGDGEKIVCLYVHLNYGSFERDIEELTPLLAQLLREEWKDYTLLVAGDYNTIDAKRIEKMNVKMASLHAVPLLRDQAIRPRALGDAKTWVFPKGRSYEGHVHYPHTYLAGDECADKGHGATPLDGGHLRTHTSPHSQKQWQLNKTVVAWPTISFVDTTSGRQVKLHYDDDTLEGLVRMELGGNISAHALVIFELERAEVTA